MRKAFSGIAALALAAASVSVATGQTGGAMSGMSMHHSYMMPKCTPATGPVVWFMSASKRYYMKGAAQYGKGAGMYVCRATAVGRGGKPGMAGSMGGSMGHGSMGHGSMGHGSTTGTGSSSGSGSTTGTGPMTSPMTMAPRPISSSPAMPGNTPGPGLPNSTNSAPGSRGSPMPTSSGSMGSASGNQGNTGAPGAGGQVPNNPGSSSNSTTPGPSPSPRP